MYTIHNVDNKITISTVSGNLTMSFRLQIIYIFFWFSRVFKNKMRIYTCIDNILTILLLCVKIYLQVIYLDHNYLLNFCLTCYTFLVNSFFLIKIF